MRHQPEDVRNDDELWRGKSAIATEAPGLGLGGRARDGGADHAASGAGVRPAEDGPEARAVPEDAQEQSEVLDLPALRPAGLLQDGRRQDRPERLVRAVRPEAEVVARYLPAVPEGSPEGTGRRPLRSRCHSSRQPPTRSRAPSRPR